jgi:hypothetical protein
LPERVLNHGKVVYNPTERALSGKVTISPEEAPGHVKVVLHDGSERYIHLAQVVSITGSEKNES